MDPSSVCTKTKFSPSLDFCALKPFSKLLTFFILKANIQWETQIHEYGFKFSKPLQFSWASQAVTVLNYWSKHAKHINRPKAGFRLACHSPHCGFIAWSLLAISEFEALSGHAALAFPPKDVILKLNRSQLTVGKAARLLIDWLDAAHHLIFPLRRVELYKNHFQSANAASGKLVLKQHNPFKNCLA